MTPTSAVARSTSLRSVRAPATGTAPKRPTLRILERGPRRGTKMLRALAVGLVALSLLAVVVGHSMLAQGQVRLTAEQAQMAAERAIHRQLLASVAKAEDPSTIVAKARNLNLVPPTSITQLPAVSLTTPLASGSSGSSSTQNTASGQSQSSSSGR